MSDHWMPSLDLRMSQTEFEQLPRSPAYSYEYHDGRAILSPRPRYHHPVLSLRDWRADAAAEVTVRPLVPEDWGPLSVPFCDAFARQQPFGGLSNDMRLIASRQALEQTRRGGDGPFIPQASFVADQGESPIGALLITLVPDRDPSEWTCCLWDEPPPPGAVERRLGRPHLTWVFVKRSAAGRGIGTALLARAVVALLGLGFEGLISTFMLGNESSMLWHWRNGFQLVSYPGSSRRAARTEWLD